VSICDRRFYWSRIKQGYCRLFWISYVKEKQKRTLTNCFSSKATCRIWSLCINRWKHNLCSRRCCWGK